MPQPSPYRAVQESLFRIVDRHGVAVDFKLNDQQAKLDAEWERRNVVTKIRQHAGCTTAVVGRYVAKCIGEQNRRCVLLSAEADATARLLARARFMVNNMRLPPGVPKPKLGTDNTRALTFENTGSWFWIGTAGQRTFGRGDTITDLLMSEAAFYQDAQRIADGLFPAAELGEIAIESTGNGRGNWFHSIALAARENKSYLGPLGAGFKLHEFYWPGMESCRIPLNPEQEEWLLNHLDPALEEPELFDAQIGLSQLAWRRQRIIEDYKGDLSKFKENYPRTFDECFQSSGRSFFGRVNWRAAAWVEESKALHVLEGHPKAGHAYVAGVDVGAGIGKDNSVIEVFDLDERVQAAEWVANDVAPDELGRILTDLGKRFNNAYINVERNNHGLTTIAALVSRYPLDRLHRGTDTNTAASQFILSHINNYGTYVSETTRALLLGRAKEALRAEYTIHSPLLQSELDTFVESSTGKYEADAGCMDDRVMAACHALLVVERAVLVCMSPVAVSEETPLDNPFSWEYIFERGRSKGRYGISGRFSQ